MAVPDPQLRYATDVFDANGVTTDWQISFTGGYIDPSHVYAMSGILDEETQLLTDRTSHSVEVLSEDENSSTVRVGPAVAAGRKLYIYRSTPVQQMLVDYVNGSIISKTNLNLSNDQLLKIIQEMFDSMNIATLTIDQQIGVVMDLNKLITEIYKEVLELLAAGGIVSVTPRTWSGTWAGAQETDEEWELVGADVEDAGFYDTYVNGYGLDPEKDFEIILGATPADTKIRFKTVPAPGSKWFTVLRGYARPYTGPKPITQADLRVRIVESDGPVFYPDVDSEYGLVRCNDPTATEVRLEEIPAVADTKLGDGSYMSFVQKGGPVTIVPAPGVVLNVPAGCAPKTRGLHSTITITCEFADGNAWLLSGDLAKEE